MNLHLQKHGIESEAKYNNLKVNTLNWTGNDTSVNGKELFDKVVNPIQEYLDKIYVRLDTSLPNNDTGVTYTGETLNSSLFAAYGHRKYGNCYVYQPAEELLDLGIYYIKFTL